MRFIKGRNPRLSSSPKPSAYTAIEPPADSSSTHVILAVGCPADLIATLEPLMQQADPEVNLLTVSTGAAALELLHGNTFHIIVLNIGIPDIDARDLFTTLREAPETAAIPVLFVGQRITASVRNHPCRTTIDGHLDDTVSPEEITAWITMRLQEPIPDDRITRLDPLTELPNRAAFCLDFKETTETFHASHEPVALAMVSLHMQGNGGTGTEADLQDCCILELARVLSSSLRATDYLARWSLGSFVVLLAGEDTLGATRAIEKVLSRYWQSIATACDSPSRCLVLSAGVTLVTPEMLVANAVASAERYLFMARTAGGNQVVSSNSRLYRRSVHALVLISDKLMGNVISNLLDHAEIRVVHASTLKEAETACSGRQRFQLIVIDECLGKGEGFHALEQLKALARNRAVPTIMLLAEHSEMRIARALELGANDYAGRPFAPLPFISRVQKLLEHGSSQQSETERCYRILVVDRSLDDLILAGATLHHHGGFQVYLALGVDDIQVRLSEQPVDIILAPLSMLKHEKPFLLRSDEEPLSLDVAFVATSEKDQEQLSRLYERQISGIIHKPFNVATLGPEIEQITGISPSRKTNIVDSEHISNEITRVLTLVGPMPRKQPSESGFSMQGGSKLRPQAQVQRKGQQDVAGEWEW